MKKINIFRSKIFFTILFSFTLTSGAWAQSSGSGGGSGNGGSGGGGVSGDIENALFGSGFITQSLSTKPSEIDFYGGYVIFDGSAPLGLNSGDMTFGAEVTPFQQGNLYWSVGWERMSRSGTSAPTTFSSGPVIWNAPVNGLYTGPSFQFDLGDGKNIYFYGVGGLFVMSDFVASDTVQVENLPVTTSSGPSTISPAYTINVSTIGGEFGFGGTFYKNGNIEIGADISYRIADFKNISYNSPSASVPAAPSQLPTEINYSGPNLLLYVALDAAETPQPEFSQNQINARQLLTTLKYDYDQTSFTRAVTLTDVQAVQAFFDSGFEPDTTSIEHLLDKIKNVSDVSPSDLIALKNIEIQTYQSRLNSKPEDLYFINLIDGYPYSPPHAQQETSHSTQPSSVATPKQ
jgi:hypothetical protein